MQAQSQQPKYFDLQTSGIGYMKRFRVVTPDKAKGQRFKPFASVTIAAISGEDDDVKYVNYDVNIKGAQAISAIEVLKPYLVDAADKPLNNKVLVGFRIGDAIPEIYIGKDKDGKPEPRVSLKGRLLKITSAKVNGDAIALPMTEYDEAKSIESQAEAYAAASGAGEAVFTDN